MNRINPPTYEQKKEFVLDLKDFLERKFDEKKSDDGQSEDFYKHFKLFMQRKPDGQAEDNHERSKDLYYIKTWLNDLNENLIAQTPSTPDPVWAFRAFNDYNELYIKGWRPGQIPSASPGFLGHPRKSKKQRKSRKNTRKSRKNTRNNRKRRT